jgi:hypothetical protein
MLIFNSKAVVERRGFRPKIFDDPEMQEEISVWDIAVGDGLNA